MKKIALVVIAFAAFSCTKDENNVLKPLSIAELARVTPEFSDFSRSLDSLGLTSTFESAGNFTVFVPDNDALGAAATALGFANLDSIFKNPAARLVLTNILRYHVVTTGVLSTDLANNQIVTSLYGQDFKVNIAPVLEEDATYPGEKNTITLTGNNLDIPSSAIVVARDVRCTNGIVHPIDAVIVPMLPASRRK